MPAEIALLPVPANVAQISFRGLSSFLPAPWLTQAILSSGTNDSLELIVECRIAADLFNIFHRDNIQYKTSAIKHLEDFANWAWGVHQGRVPSMAFTLNPDDRKISSYKRNRILQCVMGDENTSPQPLQVIPMPKGIPPDFSSPTIAILLQLANGISCQTKEAQAMNSFISRQLEHNIEKEEKKKDRLKKLHPSVMKFLLFASVENANIVPTDINEGCKCFINAESEGLADQELNIQFQTRNLPDVAFSMGFTQALYGGRFRWADQSTPSEFSPFLMYEVEPIQAAEQQNRHFVLHIILTQGKGRTLDEIKSSSKQIVKAPTTYLEMLSQLKFFAGACDLFFGEHSTATTSINTLIIFVKKYKQTFRANEIQEEFVSQFLFAVDKRMQMWFESIVNALVRADVDESPLNLFYLVKSVRYGNFTQWSPPTFLNHKDAKKRKQLLPKITEDGSKKPKGSKVIMNPSPSLELKLLPGKTWISNFANKSEGHPWWDKQNQVKMCACWHISGHCFNDCHNAKSHVTKEEITSDKLSAFKEYLRKCRLN
jgi:hypothetical protein